MNDANCQIVLECCREFVALQEMLLGAWGRCNSSSHDFDLLTDFPRHESIHAGGFTWLVSRHGVGVRFVRTDLLEVDVPFGVTVPDEFDENRVFDFYISSNRFSQDCVPVLNRNAWYQLTDLLVFGNKLDARTDNLGRRILKIRDFESER